MHVKVIFLDSIYISFYRVHIYIYICKNNFNVESNACKSNILRFHLYISLSNPHIYIYLSLSSPYIYIYIYIFLYRVHIYIYIYICKNNFNVKSNISRE